MGIDVHWRDERGETLATVDDPEMLLSRLSNLLSKQSDSVCLRFIDPVGDACFNQHQIPVLLDELRQVLPSVSDTRTVKHLHNVVRLIEGAGQVHTYVWFVGD